MKIDAKLSLEVENHEHKELTEEALKTIVTTCKAKGTFNLKELDDAEAHQMCALIVQKILIKIFKGEVNVIPPF